MKDDRRHRLSIVKSVYLILASRNFALMKVYVVSFENNEPTTVRETSVLKHGDVAYNTNGTVRWYVVECDSEELARKVAESTVKKIWEDYTSSS